MTTQAVTAEASKTKAGSSKARSTLAISVVAVAIVVLNNTVVNVAIPSILRDFDTSLAAVQWTVTGYSLTVGALMIIGGRIGDLYGHRRMFIIGAGLFGFGSFIASVSNSVLMLVVGEALIAGIGAAFMTPATLAILTTTFSGKQRATAFAVWGAVAGAASGFGPVVGGFLTTHYSWRWAFRINVVIAPIAMLGAIIYMMPSERSRHRSRLDLGGAALVGTGLFFLVFGLSHGGAYGWIRPLRDLRVLGRDIWPATRGISVVVVISALALVFLLGFYRFERAKEQRGLRPLFEFSELRHKSFRYGLLTTIVLALGQFGLIFILPFVLQYGKGLSAARNGLWMLPTAIVVVLGAWYGGKLTKQIGTVSVVRLGLALEAVGLLYIAVVISPALSFWILVPGLAGYGMGVGFATSQLTNIVLSEVSTDKAGAASGANVTARQVGAALGTALIGSLLSANVRGRAVHAIEESALPSHLSSQAINDVVDGGVNFVPPTGTSDRQVATLKDALASAVAGGARPALLFAAAVVLAGAFLSFLIPQADHERAASDAPD